MKGPQRVNHVAIIGNYPPRQCGIATFTADIVEAVTRLQEQNSIFAVAINDIAQGYDYPATVRFQVRQDDLDHYRQAADFLNLQAIDVVSLQHEYGIFGGVAGRHILALLDDLNKPVVTTLHTILEAPNPQQRAVMEEIVQRSERLVVMSELGARFLQDVHRVPAEKIDVIPHGIPDVALTDSAVHKEQFGWSDKTVLLTCGLLSPNKGIEQMIHALPDIAARHANVIYAVVGVTHPHLKRRDGESYRLSLQRLARSLGVEKHVVFYNRFATLSALMAFIGAADVYITPYCDPKQITSGTLAYALGAGKAVVSTPYWYAEELLADGRGLLTPFDDREALAKNINWLLSHEAERHEMEKRAYLYSRQMVWSQVATRYCESFEKAQEGWSRRQRAVSVPRTLEARPNDLPILNLEHLQRMTDSTGILQHALYMVPNYAEGYTSDDNARALIASMMLETLGETVPQTQHFAPTYLAFLAYAFNPATGRFRNFLSYARHWLEETGSEDSHGRALWALGTVLGRGQRQGLRDLALQLLSDGLPVVTTFSSPRAWAFTLLGIHEYLFRYPQDKTVRAMRDMLAQRLVALYEKQSRKDWPWFEPGLSYCNAKLPHALLITGSDMGRKDMVDLGLSTLQWLIDIQKPGRYFSFIGSDGFYNRGEERAQFDQQPVEANGMVSACLTAYHITNNGRWLQEAYHAFEWFLGDNDLGLSLYDPLSGGCRDGLHPDRLNQNQGAESSLAFLLSLLELRLNEALSLIPSATGANQVVAGVV